MVARVKAARPGPGDEVYASLELEGEENRPWPSRRCPVAAC